MINEESTVYIFGLTLWGLILYNELKNVGHSVFFLDNSEDKQKKYDWNGIVCIAPKDACPNVDCIIAVETQKNVTAIKKQLSQMGFSSIIIPHPDEMNKRVKMLDDMAFIEYMWFVNTGFWLDINNPKSFNEKIQWLKLYNRKTQYTNMVDKYEAKKYVSERLDQDCIIPTLGIWNTPEDINFENLPQKFVLKCTHDSGSVFICKDKKTFDVERVKKQLQEALNRNYYEKYREWPYRDVKPRIIAEQLLEDESSDDVMDYKIHCFNGVPKLIQVDYDRFTNHKRNIYDAEWTYLDVEILYKTDKGHIIERPRKLEEMLMMASKLSEDMPYIRIDFYYINERIFFGEMTFHHGAGYEPIRPESFGREMGDWIDLPQNEFT